MGTIFVAVTGQRDNIGDSLLRRPMLAATDPTSTRHVLVGDGAEDYASNLGLVDSDVLYTDRRAWLIALAKSAFSRRTHLMLNAGEATLNARYVGDRLVLLPIFILLRVRGGRVIQTGVGLRRTDSRWTRPARPLLRLTALLTWRDGVSRNSARIGQVQPDWAFREGAPTEVLANRRASRDERTVILSLRGDRPEPDADWLEAVRDALSAVKATPIIVCQVRRDEARSRWLANRLGAEYVHWAEETTHLEQEAILRARYSRATWVVSDRLHVLIAALTEGAAILPWAPDRGAKLARTLEPAGLSYRLKRPNVDDLQVLAAEDLSALDRARGALSGVVAKIRALTGNPATGRPLTVLHSIAAPGSETRYATHMQGTAGEGVEVRFFSWQAALLGGYDVFHLHWPEHLVGVSDGPRARLRYLLLRLLFLRLRLRRTPVVRTLHNLVPHDDKTNPRVREVTRRFEALTEVEIHLVDEAGERDAAQTFYIPHGSYVEVFGAHPHADPVLGRLIHFGLLKKYKGVEALLAAFDELDEPNLQLRIVGKPIDGDTARTAKAAADRDKRITVELAFVPDAQLVEEISSSELVVLPYKELHSSGAVLVALSVGRPVLVPSGPTSRALREEVGDAWVHLFQPPLSPSDLSDALDGIRRRPEGQRPDLSARTWESVRTAHRRVYLAAMNRRG
ncbi:glycosyltransferase [Agromyces silvae]|uniref:glycosyltransferase n=1 Tax=Agromyces silvae TaxID=3388266 RepID=UPI00280BB961|nr:glycosyltransferase [Agromyces protaetiae]